jgi:hypothetical protein
MIANLSATPTNLNEYMGHLKALEPEALAQQIRAEVLKFMEANVKENNEEETLLLVGRKAALLFSPFFEKFRGKTISQALGANYPPQRINYELLNTPRIIRNPSLVRKLNGTFWTSGRMSPKISLLADSINTGAEILSVGRAVKKKGHKICNIYCYASNAETVKKLEHHEPFSDSNIVCAHKFDPNEATPFFRSVQAYYQSLLDPVDSDHAYNIYHGAANLNAETISKVIQFACQQIFGNNSLSFEQDIEGLYLPKNVKNMTADVGNIDPAKTRFNPQLNDFLTLLDFNFPFIRLKTLSEKKSTEFSIMASFPFEPIDVQALWLKRKCQVCNKSKCYANLVKSNLDMKSLRELLCPMCLTNYVERSILKKISNTVMSMLEPMGGAYRGICIEKHDPIEREI